MAVLLRLTVLFYLITHCYAASAAPVFSLPPTGKLAYPADNYANLLSTPISIQAETNGGFSILGKFFLVSSTTYPWRLYQMRNFDLAVSGALDIQFQLYQMTASSNYEFQFRQMRSSDTCHFSFPKLTGENSWYTIAVKYSTVDDSFELRFNNVIVLQGSCPAGYLENFELNRVLVQEQNWAGLRLYDSLLTDAEVASELDKICVQADACGDVLTAGCDSAPACPAPPIAPVSVTPVFSLPPTEKLAYPADNYANLLSTPISIQAETNAGFSILGKFFFASSDVQPWGKLFQLRNFNLEIADANYLQIMFYQADTAAKYRFQIWKSGSSCQEEFAKPATDNAWYSVEMQYDTATDIWKLFLNDVLVAQTTCNAGWLENFYLNRVIVASQNWAGLRLYDSLLTDAEVASELDKICVQADACGDVLTAGCDSPTAALCPAITPSQDPKHSKPASSAYHIDGGGWKLVRRVKAGSSWHPATDWLAGTDEYGTYTTDETIDDTFSIRYDHLILGNIDFLFATGDGTYWLIATREQIGGVQLGFSDYSSSPDYLRTFTSSTGKTSAVWYNRQAFNKDPMISQNDWGSDPLYMMYRGASVPEHTELVLNHNGMNVFIRTSYCPDNFFASSGAALSFNPRPSEETFTRSAAQGFRLPDKQMNFNSNGGFSMVSKFKFTGSSSGSEMLLAVVGVGINIYFKRHSDLTMQIHIQYNHPTLGSLYCNLYDMPAIAQNVESTATIVLDLQANSVSLDITGTQHSSSCGASFTLPDILCAYNQVGDGFWATAGEFFNGDMHGIYFFDRPLASTETQKVLDGILVGSVDTLPSFECTPCPTDGSFIEECSSAISCPQGSTLPPGSSTLNDCTCDSRLRSDLGPIYDGRPPVSAWSYSALSSDASCSNPINFGVHDGVDTATAGTACFAAVNADNYLQLDMSTELIVTGIQTMGRASDSEYVTLYQIQVSQDELTWTDAPCAEVDSSGFCVGNSDAGSVKQNDLASKVVARYVKLIVKGYSGHESLRMSVLSQTCVSCPNVAWQHYQPPNS